MFMKNVYFLLVPWTDLCMHGWQFLTIVILLTPSIPIAMSIYFHVSFCNCTDIQACTHTCMCAHAH